MARTLITNGYVICVDPARQVLPNGFVFAEAEQVGAELVEQAGLGDRFGPAWRI